MFKKLLIAASVSLALVACSFDKNDGNNDVPRAKENARKQEDFNRVIGTYKGTLTTSTTVQTVSFTLYTLSANNGTEISLNSNYKRISPIGKDFNFKVDYIPETGALTFSNTNLESNPNAGKIEADDIHTISAKVANKQIVGEVKSKSGVIGILNASLSAQENGNPGDKQEQEYYDRLAVQYNTIAGVYVGQLINDDGSKRELEISLRVRKKNLNGYTVPELYGAQRRLDDANGNATLVLTSVDYQLDFNPPRLNTVGVPRDFTDPSRDLRVLCSAIIQNKALVGSCASFTLLGYQGNFNLTKVKGAQDDVTPAPGTNPEPPKNDTPAYIVCVAGDLKVRDESLNNTLFSAKSGEKVIPSTVEANMKKKVIGGKEYTFTKTQFPNRKGTNVGWVAQEFIRLEGQCK